jgi:hypothetical protein
VSNNNIIITNHNSQKNPIIPLQQPCSQPSIPIITQSLPLNGADVTNSLTPFTNETVSAVNCAFNQNLLPSFVSFNSPANQKNQHAASASQHTKPVKGHVNLDLTSVQSLTNHFQTLSQPIHASQPAKKHVPTSQHKPILTNHKVTPQPCSPTLINQNNPITPTVAPVTKPILRNKNIIPLPFPVTVMEDSEGVENMDVQVERKRRREEEMKKGSSSDILNQHFLSAGPGSQDCREQ